jgi:hypothetical protein
MLYELTSNIDAIILTDDNMELITKYCVFPVIIYSSSYRRKRDVIDNAYFSDDRGGFKINIVCKTTNVRK